MKIVPTSNSQVDPKGRDLFRKLCPLAFFLSACLGMWAVEPATAAVVSIWPNTAVPATISFADPDAVEVGVKFKSDVAGTINGIRFYKAVDNTNTHIGSLWTIDGTSLANVTFINETESGWQEALFATPVAIDSNTVYVASYHSNNGHYSADANYFSGKGMDSPPLHALADGVSGGNGVFAYGLSSIFPNGSYGSANYWVDVVFQPGSGPVPLVIVVTPANTNISIGGSQQFTATGTYSDGSTRDLTSQVTWISSNTLVATITAGGLATGVSTGSTRITAILNGVVNGYTMLTVQPTTTLISIAVTPANTNISIGGSRQFTATGTYSDGSTRDLTSQVTWISSNTLVATISVGGLATGVSAGSTPIVAILSGVSGYTMLTVQPTTTLISIAVTPANTNISIGGSRQFTATGTYSDGSTRDLTSQVTWISSNTLVATISAGGLATGVSAGSTPIVAILSGVSGYTMLTVQPTTTLISIAVTPANTNISIGGSRQFTATGTYSDGSTRDLTSQVTWISSNTLVATISAGGLATGVSAGSTPIVAILSGVSGYTMLTVQPTTTLISIAVTPANTNISIGGSRQFTATGTYSDGSTRDLTSQVTWISSNTLVATISAGGLATGVSAGSTPIVAILSGVSGYTMLTVQPTTTLISIAVTPANTNISIGGSRQFTATGTYSDGSTRDLTSQVTWISSNTLVATISAGGLATGVSAGSTPIVAILTGVTGYTMLTVQVAPLTITTTSLPAGTVSLAYTTTLTAEGGILPYTWSLAGGSLPPGLTFASTGVISVISGTPTATGTFNFTVQVRDASSPQQTATKTLSITITSVSTVASIWPNTATPGVVDGGPDGAGELGVKFRSDVRGTVTGIRFYKAGANTGVHIGNLWTSNGTRLATVIFSNETASGWQQALFATPVTIASNTVYVASYHANNGHYSEDLNYFSGKGVDNPPLHALANGVSGGNGVYRYSTNSLFPNRNWNAANYWVDVVFQGGPAPILTSIAVTPANTNISIGGSRQFTATGTYSDGSTQDLTSQVTWISSNTLVATISAGGLARGISAGSTPIVAILTGVTGYTMLTVQVAPLVITTTSLPAGTVNIAYATTLTAGGGILPYAWSIASGSLPPGLTLASTGVISVISGTPTAVGTFSFTVQVRDAGSPPQTATKTLSITITSMSTAVTIWPSTAVPERVDEGPDSAVELGVKFKSDVAGTITGIRFYKADANIGVHVGNLWTSDGVLLATVNFINETVSGWQQALFATPVTIASNTVYVASYHASSGHYSVDELYFLGKGMDNPPLHALADGVSGGNGVYAYGMSSAFPDQTWNTANYWVDVVFQAGPVPILTSIAVTPANTNISIGGSRQFTATGTYSDGSTRDLTSQVTWISSNTLVATISAGGLATGRSAGSTPIVAILTGVTGYTMLTVQVAPLTITTTSLPAGTVSLAYTTTLTAEGGILPYIWSITGGSLPPGLTFASTGVISVISGTPTATGTFSFVVQVRDAGSQTTNKSLSITITSMSTAVTIWPSTAVPGVVDDGPDNPVELGVMFKSDVAGIITGIRFYKSEANIGIHDGNLWTSDGTRLATVRFNETASGWQQALFAAPVAIASNTVYVASYHANNGHYSEDENYFDGKGMDNPPLHALANGVSGGNGVYAYGTSSAFPNQTYNAANYWVDVVFQRGSPPPPPLPSLTRTTADASTSEAGGNVEQGPSIWTSGDFSGEFGAANLIDGNTNTMWIGNVGGDPWRIILDLGAVTDVTGVRVMFQDTLWMNMGILGSRDNKVWFDYLAETNEWLPLRYLCVNFWTDEQSAQPPAVREIIWRNR